MSDGLHKVHLNLTKAQHNKLRLGHPVQLSAGALHGTRHHVMVHHELAKKLHKAKRLHKGARMSLSAHEYHHSAAGLAEFLAGVKNAANKVGDFYQKNVKPIAAPYLKQGAKYLLDSGVAALSLAQPELAPVLAAADKQYGNKLVDFVGNQTGAYGLRHRKHAAIHARAGALGHEPIYSPATPEYGPLVMPLPQFGGYIKFHSGIHVEPHRRNARGGGLNSDGVYVEGLPEIGNVGPLKGGRVKSRKSRAHKAGSFLAV